MKKIEEGLKKDNGKPYLRTRFVISNARFLLGKWHVFQKSYPCVGKTDDFVQGRHEQKSVFFQLLLVFQWKKYTFWDERRNEKNEFWRRCFRNCTFYAGEGHFFADDTKREKRRKREKKSKKCQKGIKSRMVPQVVQNKAFGEGTRRAVNEVTLVWSQKLIQKDAFDLQRLMRHPVEF